MIPARDRLRRRVGAEAPEHRRRVDIRGVARAASSHDGRQVSRPGYPALEVTMRLALACFALIGSSYGTARWRRLPIMAWAAGTPGPPLSTQLVA